MAITARHKPYSGFIVEDQQNNIVGFTPRNREELDLWDAYSNLQRAALESQSWPTVETMREIVKAYDAFLAAFSRGRT